MRRMNAIREWWQRLVCKVRGHRRITVYDWGMARMLYGTWHCSRCGECEADTVPPMVGAISRAAMPWWRNGGGDG